MGIDHLIFGALMAIVVLLFATVAGVHRIVHVLNILEDRSRPRRCRECGCTDEFGCDDEPFGSCYWVTADLCSRCARCMEWDR